MISVSPSSRVLIAVVALLLLLPIATIPLNDDAKLERFHNRTLAKWPAADTFVHDPAGYFRQGSHWIADRAGPIVQAAALQKKMLIYVLGTPPQRRITLGNHGYIFVNGGREERVNGLLRAHCIESRMESTRLLLERALPSLRVTGQRLGVSLYAVAVPMSSTLYADELPDSVPPDIRTACLTDLNGETSLTRFNQQPQMNFVYPFGEMKALRDTEGFFPKADYHPRGLSMKVIRDAYLRRVGSDAQIEEILELKGVPSEILETYGVIARYPQQVIRNEGIGNDAAATGRVMTQLADLFNGPAEAKVFTNAGPAASKTALLLSDSVGIAGAPVFAGAFKRLVWVYTNTLGSQGDVGKVFDRVVESERLDSVILLLNEGSAPKFATWADAFAAQSARSGVGGSPN